MSTVSLGCILYESFYLTTWWKAYKCLERYLFQIAVPTNILMYTSRKNLKELAMKVEKKNKNGSRK